MAIMVYGEGGASTYLDKKTFPFFHKTYPYSSQFKTRLILLEQANRLSNKIELADMYKNWECAYGNHYGESFFRPIK